MTDDPLFAVGRRGHCRVAGFGDDGEWRRVVEKKTGRTKARARPDRKHRRARDSALLPDWIKAIRLKCGQRPGNSFKIVEKTDHPEAELLLHDGAVDDPWAVGNRAAVILHRSCDGQDCSSGSFRSRMTGEERRH